MTRTRWLVVAAAVLAVATGIVFAQRGGYRTVRPIEEDRRGVANWENDPKFKNDVFTFVRIEYDTYRGRWGWRTDWPDAELNFSFRLQQLTTLKVNPNPITMRLTDPRLFDHPFIYIVEPGGLVFSEPEVLALRKYLLNGGFLMVDDFWGDSQWANFAREMKRVFPDRDPQDVPLEHEIFHVVYNLKERPQLPSIGVAHQYKDEGITWEPWHDGNTKDVHFRALYDDKGRMMAFICHNTDNGDGWEREGEDPWYFKEFSEKKAYPLGINIVVYAMTH
jgi:hypothetical protein